MRRLLKRFYLLQIPVKLHTSKATGIEQILAKYWKDGAEVLNLPFRSIINFLIKLSTFPEECKTAKLRLPLKSMRGLISKTADLFYFCC